MSSTTITAEMTEAMAENSRLLSAMENKPCVLVTQNQLFDILNQNIKGCSFAGVYAITSYSPGKSGTTKKARDNGDLAESRFAFPIQKGYSVSFPLGADYASCVEKQMEREEIEGDFHSVGYVNGMTVINKFFCQNEKSGNIHFRISIPATMAQNAFGDSVYIDANGVKLSEEKVEDLKKNFLKAESVSSRQDTEEKVLHITPLLDNVVAIAVGGVIYKILK